MSAATANMNSNETCDVAGYEVVESRYVNMPGWFSWLLLVRLLRQEPTSPTTVKIFDRYIVPVVRWVEDRIRMPFGQSVFLVARKPAARYATAGRVRSR